MVSETRTQRTGAEESLRRAVVELASEKPLTSISVSEVCRRAEVSRDSFYRFAASPTDLLAAYLFDDHEVAAVVPNHESASSVRGLVPAIVVLIEHVQRNFDIYRNALSPHLPPAIQEVLLQRIRQVGAGHVREFPEKVPPIPEGLDRDQAIDVYITYVAFATVGAVELLVRSGTILNTQLSLDIFKAAIAPSWLLYD